MLSLPASVRIFLATEPCDMRKGIDGLAASVHALDSTVDIYSGHLFVFISRGRDRLKILTWQTGGFVVFYKRLERGRFKIPRGRVDAKSVLLGTGELAMLLEGIDFSRLKRPSLWQPP